ncbi:U32 family peptidase [Kangiella profundi]|uniref:Ubiquinone biosynthesis protein UbiV n=1 Tax=Kangiella profundi TaxID=1561924 RepID=A0A2K9B0S3_9GAMM|nr:U32 family peptidase [Kangiella profundi]AUD78528.1 U32 family peptidase [Kangiella profundi]GGF08678.1 U32 family peptidase [Kangiella profundi]
MKTSLAAVPYFWTKQAYQDFYLQVADTDIDTVYLGETVCSKRRSMTMQDWIEIGSLLASKDKQVVLSTMTLLEAESELNYLKKIVQQGDFLVEANDMSAIQVANQASRPFVAGNAINIYNNQSLGLFNRLGMTRWNIPVELGQEDLKPVIPQAKALGVELEYQVYGRMPLAYSARCFTARHHDLPKDRCQFKCKDDVEGIPVRTREGDSFAQINGIQTQSGKVSNLLNHWQKLHAAGIDYARIVPVAPDTTLQVIQSLTHAIACNQPQVDFTDDTREYCNGYWFQMAGLEMIA